MRTSIQKILLVAAVGLLGACSAQETPATPTPVAIANPASDYCIQQGGTLEMQSRGEMGEYGVCVFEDGRVCEEWALWRGGCPATGVDVSGYATTAAVYCASTGAQYTVTGNEGAEDEQGTCALTNGQTCDVWEFYGGECGLE